MWVKDRQSQLNLSPDTVKNGLIGSLLGLHLVLSDKLLGIASPLDAGRRSATRLFLQTRRVKSLLTRWKAWGRSYATKVS